MSRRARTAGSTGRRSRRYHYWKPFYYLLEDAPFEVMLVAPDM